MSKFAKGKSWIEHRIDSDLDVDGRHFTVNLLARKGTGVQGFRVTLVFLPHDERDRETIKELFARIIAEEGQTLLGWRPVPTDNRLIGDSAKATQPVFEQLFIDVSAAMAGDGAAEASADARSARAERKLYVIRKRVEHAVDRLKTINALSRRFFFVVSLSTRRLVYKGMLQARQLEPMFPDLSDARVASALALVHQRFSTNTFPSWPLAQPMRTPHAPTLQDWRCRAAHSPLQPPDSPPQLPSAPPLPQAPCPSVEKDVGVTTSFSALCPTMTGKAPATSVPCTCRPGTLRFPASIA